MDQRQGTPYRSIRIMPQSVFFRIIDAFCFTARFALLLTLGTASLSGQSDRDLRVQVANLTQDMGLLTQEVRSLRLEVEAVKRDNAALRQRVEGALGSSQQADLTLQALQARLDRLDRAYAAADAALKKTIIQEVSKQIANLARQTQATIDALAGAINVKPTVSEPAVSFSDDYPREGIVYEVEAGDTLSGIARKLNSSVNDIRNANRIADPRTIRVGQQLFIPQQD
ncbi:MAG: LysM peptidoglycan-binding domain-containing protein [Opitutales bacterium]